MSSDVLPTGARCLYRDTASDSNLVAHVVKVHYDDVPPYYTVRIEGKDGERETIRSRLTTFIEDTAPTDEVVASTAAFELLELASLPGATESASRLFKDIDADGDGAVTKRELKAYLASHGRDAAAAERMFTAMDSDEDGILDYAEFKKLHQEAIRSVDSEAKDVWRTLFADAGGADQLFDAIDTDRDGALTRKEVAAYLTKSGGNDKMAARLLAVIDGDKDGLLDRQEVRGAYRWAASG